jgi:ubiquinone/menaquinone biosynthesis C-methylase UbiE
MPDVYAEITKVEPQMLDAIADALEVRSADHQQVEMRNKYFAWLDLPAGAKVLEAGCGAGPVARHLASFTKSSTVVGLDPSPHFIEKAKELSKDFVSLEFQVGDARSMPFEEASFDAVIFHTCLCHVPEAERAIAEAFRVLKPGGKLGVFDGDYATTTFSTGPDDPLQQCADAMMGSFVHDMWLTRRLPALLRQRGFRVERMDSHGYVQNDEPVYSFTIIDRGADVLVANGQIEAQAAATLKSEARSRADAGEFYGFINFISVIATRP